MTPVLLAQLAFLFLTDAEASESDAEFYRLRSISRELFTRAESAGWVPGGTDAAFGDGE